MFIISETMVFVKPKSRQKAWPYSYLVKREAYLVKTLCELGVLCG